MEKQVVEALRQCPLFQGMDPAEVEYAMASVGYRVIKYPKQDVYTLAGMPCRHVDIVVEGILVCRMTSLSGKQVEVSRLRRGNMIAPAFIFSKDNAMPVSVETDSKVTICRMTPDALQTLMDQDERIRMNFLRTLSNINVFLTHKIKVLSLFTVREKVAWLLLERAREQKSMEIHLFRSRQEIADSFGIQKYSLMRVLADFEKAGAIRIEGRKITICNQEKLL